MKRSSDLFLLIHSLDRNEKRYFKLFAAKYSSNKKNKYLELFDAIGSMEEYDELKLKKKLSGKNLSSNLSAQKNYLYNLTLQSLRNYPEHNSTGSEIKDLLREVEILYKKGLYDQCAKLLGRARLKAEKYEKFPALLEIIEWEGLILLLNENAGLAEDHINSRLPEARHYIEKIENTLGYTENHFNMFCKAVQYGEVRSPLFLEELERIVNLPAYLDERNAKTFMSKYYLYFLLGLFYRRTGNIEKLSMHCTRELNLFNEYPGMKKELAALYVNSLINSCVNLLELERYDECQATLETLKKADARSVVINMKSSARYFSIYTNIITHTGDFRKITELVKGIDHFVGENSGRLKKSAEILIYFNAAYCFFGNGNFKQSLHWLNKLLHDPVLERGFPDLHCFARMLNLLIHYELGNYDLLDHVLRSTKRYLNKNEQLYEVEELVLRFIENIRNENSGNKIAEGFAKFRKNYLSITSDPAKPVWSRYFDFSSWALSKIENISFEEAVKKTNNNTGVQM